MLSVEQKKIKQEGIAETIKYTNDKNDAKYAKFIASGNIQAAQSMVDEAAKAAGYTIKAYHGTSNDFWEFKKGHKRTRGTLNFGDGFYFAPSRSSAENYTNTGRVIEGYLKLQNPYTIYGTRLDRSDLARISTETGTDATIEHVTEVLKAHGYDGIIARSYNGTTNPVNQYVIFDAEQVKSADPITYDNDGNVIPISERFKVTKRDIRYSQRDVGRQEAVAQALEKENAKLREDVAELRELVKLQRQVTNGTKFTKTSVEAAARYLKQNADAKGSTQELAKLLNGLYEYIASGKELTWEGVKKQAQGTVDWLWQHIDRKGKPTEYA
jgi:hypothetical protein